MLPTILAKQLQDGICDYIRTTFPMTNEPFQGSLDKLISTKDSVYHAPFTAVRLPFRVAEMNESYFESIHPKFAPYVHQQKAFDRLNGNDGQSTVIATGTGSGKTECFLYPILEYCYKHRGERGIKALIIYPMNALASDQAKRIAEIIYNSPELRGNVNVGMYVGGREETPSRMMSEHGVITDHDTMLNRAPDILMTNYKMLDYLLVRPKDAVLWQDNSPETLKYIAVDELHTFDGAQGTDLAYLLRRLKARLSTPAGYLCCVGTSATIGSEDNNPRILNYASEIFGEPFDSDAIITEDRLSPSEFFDGCEVTDFSFPTNEQVEQLASAVIDDDITHFLQLSAECWISDPINDIMSDTARLKLGNILMHHSFFQAAVKLMGGKYYQTNSIAEALVTNYPEIESIADKDTAINALLALVSHARIGSGGKLRPFLNVQVQFWLRELRRLLAKVSPDDVRYSIAHDLNERQSKEYLPVVNCRDCGATGWTSTKTERGYAKIGNLDTFYNMYFRCDDTITMLFPGMSETNGFLCPKCHYVKFNTNEAESCECPDGCGEMIPVYIPNLGAKSAKTGSQDKQQYVCPFCHSKRGLSLMGLRSVSEISVSLSQMFSSQFNDDKKALAFSDNVQDAAHHAGFFNHRTWRFGLRTAIQEYSATNTGLVSLDEFQRGFISYWHQKFDDEEFISQFIAPNMTWMKAYEEMITNRKLGTDKYAKKLIGDVDSRLAYEIMLEYGLSSNIGRTLPKSSCSVAAFEPDVIERVSNAVYQRARNELGWLVRSNETDVQYMVIGYLDTLRQFGAFDDKVFYEFVEKDSSYHISADRLRWLPGLQTGRNTPRFIIEPKSGTKHYYNLDLKTDRKFEDWLYKCSQDVLNEFTGLCVVIFDELVNAGIVCSMISDYPVYDPYGISKKHIFISNNVVQMRCDYCGTVLPVSEENAAFWENAPCKRKNCRGHLKKANNEGLGYYGRLFRNGDLYRINAMEHTGLLKREDRETLEAHFKLGKSEQKRWDPNVLSCTPTLEMGIDIGDLSSVILCSMPPAQSQFLQRAGRGGRKDGNALTMAVANARPHDLYFYADPLEMIQGDVQSPKIYLQASAVLERQFTAFCMDSWVKHGVQPSDVPDKLNTILSKLDSNPADMFPFNFIHYVQDTLTRQINSFTGLFTELDADEKEELLAFANGDGTNQSPMYRKIIESFEIIKEERSSLKSNIKALDAMIKELQEKPQDSSFDEQIKELNAEKAALHSVINEINNKNVFNFLSDEGLLPNYAFPESGIILRALLYRKEEQEGTTSKAKYEKRSYEYSRPASSAISEFAPNNTFYADGRKLTVNQIDLHTSTIEPWRLCPNCSHAQLEVPGKYTASCPQCGSPAWADSGQLRNMLKVQMVYSNTEDTHSRISDDSDSRSSVFYVRQLLVDVDEDHDILCAYRMNNDDFPFGYEFVKKAALREINFGENDMMGEKVSVAGVDEIRKGFKVCRYCGTIQSSDGRSRKHSFFCKTNKNPQLLADGYETCLFLYREFETEILRMLIPATTEDTSTVRTESFIAAFMLGMKEYFGNVDHLRVAISEVPIPDADYRKQYLVIYDSVPGGTGYLKQLMNNEGSLTTIFEKALTKLEHCTCGNDQQKDGCYHCLFAYRQSNQMGSISRKTAMSMLKSILSGKNNVEKISKLGNISVNALFDSELERRFIEAFSQRNSDTRKIEVNKDVVNDKPGYILKIGNVTWEIEPQVYLSGADGISVDSKPDFIIRPVSKEIDHRPVAVFTDGFTFHKSIVADDTLKRAAILRSGDYIVWSLSYKDIQSVFQNIDEYATETLDPLRMPSGASLYKPTVNNVAGADRISPDKTSAFDLLLDYLSMEQAETAFRAHANAYAVSLMNTATLIDNVAFTEWLSAFDEVNSQSRFSSNQFAFRDTMFGKWQPRTNNPMLSLYSGIAVSKAKADRNTPYTVFAVFDDKTDPDNEKFEMEWNGFWHFVNVLQFNPEFSFVTKIGLEKMIYMKLDEPVTTVTAVTEQASANSEWDGVLEELFDEMAKNMAMALKEANAPIPDEIGYELVDNDEVIAEIEMVWLDSKVAYLTEDQMEYEEILSEKGWTIINNDTTVSKDMFGGVN